MSAGRVVVTFFLVTMTVGCHETSDDSCGCGSRHYGVNYTSAPRNHLFGSMTIPHESELPTLADCESEGCSWSDRYIGFATLVPQRSLLADAGDGDAGDDGIITDGGGASADADANDYPSGSTSGSAKALVAVIDLGGTPLAPATPLVDARVFTCRSRYARLRRDGYLCVDGNITEEARVESLAGTLDVRTYPSGDQSPSRSLTATTPSGGQVSIWTSTESSPPTMTQYSECY